ncbi:hypothetical protein [Mycobacteroides abscessus]|uniref:hypothetical protein n=1 Tax=Mycobacteroides abscessus TaxID=36809 RepID=UPI000D8FAAEE|nr:hypothetical protein [Mycobacteroides abscessus]SPX87809.1 Uncharacterised protein [Mycobacteroides abscessus]
MPTTALTADDPNDPDSFGRKGDCTAAADALRNAVINYACRHIQLLQAIADEHAHDAPASSKHVTYLAATTARAVLDYIEGWPS